jgi:peptide/nickel transport system substrate-binding protein
MTQFFSTLYSSVYILPEHIWKDKDAKTFTNYDPAQGWPVFTGPYTLTSSDELQIVWDRNDNWWGAKAQPAIGGTDHQTPLSMPAPERIILVGVDTAENRAAKAIANEMDTFWHMPRSVFEPVAAANPKIKSWFPDLPYAYFDPAPRHLAFNLKAPPFDNADVRWAISYAIDRQKIVDFAYEGITTVTDVFFPLTPAMKAFRDSAADLFDQYPASKFDLAASASRMTNAGYTQNSDGKWVDGQGNTVVMQINVRGGEEDQIRIAPILSDQLNAAGFDASFKITEAGALYDGIARGDILTNLQLVGGTAINVSDPWGTFELLHSRHSAPIGQIATGQRSRFENPEFDSIVDQMASMTTGDPRMKGLFRSAMEIILREMPIVPLVQTALLTPNNYTYWTNWPDFQDPNNPHNYYSPSQWWGSFYHSILNIKPASASA